VVIEVIEGDKRPVAAVADHDEVRDVRRVEVLSDKTIAMRMLFDPATRSRSASCASSSGTDGGGPARQPIINRGRIWLTSGNTRWRGNARFRAG